MVEWLKSEQAKLEKELFELRERIGFFQKRANWLESELEKVMAELEKETGKKMKWKRPKVYKLISGGKAD